MTKYGEKGNCLLCRGASQFSKRLRTCYCNVIGERTKTVRECEIQPRDYNTEVS